MAKSPAFQLQAILSFAVLACSATTMASEPTMASERGRLQQTALADVALQADGTLVGRLIDGEGRAIDGAIVTLSQNQGVVGRTATDADGVYRFTKRTGGVYRLTAGQVTRDFRVWPAQAAPPGAQAFATIVETPGVIRAQLGGIGVGTAVGIGAGITGVIVGGVGLSKANDAEDDIAALRAIVNTLSP